MAIPFLSFNPNCKGCLPVRIELGCNNNCNYIANTDMIVYSGEDLPNLGVKKCDSLTVVLQKINEAIRDCNPTTTTTTTIVI